MFSSLNIKKIAAYLLLITVASFAIAAMLFFTTGGGDFGTGFSVNSPELKSFDFEKKSDMSDIKTIKFGVPSENINIIPADGNEIRVHFHGRVSKKAEDSIPELIAEVANNTLTIELKQKVQIINILSIREAILDIYIPKSYTGSIAGSVSSGNIRIDGLTPDKLDLRASSGSVNIKSVSTNGASLHVSSGNIVIEDFTGNLVSSSTSGNTDVDFRTLKNNNISIKASSGNISLRLPSESQFNLNASCSSGDVDCNFPILANKQKDNTLIGTVGSDVNKITAHTSSGNIYIIKK